MPKSNVRRGAKERKRRQDSAAAREGAGSPAPAAQLTLLDERLGKGMGAKKERARLAALMTNEKPKKKGKK